MSDAEPSALGPVQGVIQHREQRLEAASVPVTYDRELRTVDAVISTGSPVRRFYGTEVLRISPEAVDLSRLATGIPLLDHHNQGSINAILGRVTVAWFEGGALVGRIKFNKTSEGERAESMVARGEISGISAGYRVEEWEITDEDGNVIDPDRDCVRWDENLNFTATRWQLLETSLVSVPADAVAAVRSIGGRFDVASVRARMHIRQRMIYRQLRMLGGD